MCLSIGRTPDLMWLRPSAFYSWQWPKVKTSWKPLEREREREREREKLTRLMQGEFDGGDKLRGVEASLLVTELESFGW